MNLLGKLNPISTALVIAMLYCFMTSHAVAQPDTLRQTVRGTVSDDVTSAPLPGITVRVVGSDSITRGAYTDGKGRFRVQKLPVGRYVITAQGVGREPVRIDNVLVSAGKETVLNIVMSETFIAANEVTVMSSRDEDVMITNSDMAVVSARAFNVEDTKRYAGALGDPSRMAANFAGVVGANDSRNDIVVRGNSPAGMLWQVEGMNIPNPNHFGATGTTGGPVSMLNFNVLGKSDFFTSAFPANYGNAISGALTKRKSSGTTNTELEQPDNSARIAAFRPTIRRAAMYSKLIRATVGFLKREDGPTAVEYAVMLALIVVVCIAAVTSVGRSASSSFMNASLNSTLGT
jgi:Flp pilus assembly pilin Flp